MNVCILCNGEAPSKELFEYHVNQSDSLIACDAAAHIAITYKKNPDIIVGDLDSLDPALHNQSNIKHVPDQNTNDLQKALDIALEIGATMVAILGCSGLRFDHFLTNLYILPRFVNHLQISLHDNYGDAWIAQKSEFISAPIKTPISFFALGDFPVTDLNLKGLQYSLTNATLHPNSPMATLNCFTENTAQITHSNGILLIYKARI